MGTRPSHSVGYLYILASASLWGTTGILAKFLYVAGSTFQQVAFLRNLVALVAFSIILFLSKRESFRIKPGDIPVLAALGLVIVAAFTMFYFYTIQASTITQAVFLMYIGPVFTVIMGRIFLGELIVKRKLQALALSIFGMVLLTKMYNPSQLSLPWPAALAGLASAITYGFSRIVGKLALQRCSSWTTTFYSLAFGMFFLFLFTQPQNFLLQVSGRNWLLVIAMGLVQGVGAFFCFFKGLQLVEASRASIVGTLEPVVASVLALAIFGERLSPTGLLGATLILLGAILIQAKSRPR